MTSPTGAPGAGAAVGVVDAVVVVVDVDERGGGLDSGVSLAGCDLPPTFSEHPPSSTARTTAGATARAHLRMAATVSGGHLMPAEPDGRVPTGRARRRCIPSKNGQCSSDHVERNRRGFHARRCH